MEKTVKLKGTRGITISLSGNVYDVTGSEPKQLPLFQLPEEEGGNFFFLYKRSANSMSYNAIVLDEALMDQHFPDGKFPEAGAYDPSAGGARNKPFVVFNEDGSYEGTYSTQIELVKKYPAKNLHNSLPPVLKGDVRVVKGFHLFYVNDWSYRDGTTIPGYETWLNEKPNRKEGDFPHELHQLWGWELGNSRRQTSKEDVMASISDLMEEE